MELGLAWRRASRSLFLPAAWPLAGAALALLAAAVRPETDTDALIYHLALPQRWAAAHRITASPEFDAATFWLGQEALAMVPLLLGAPLAAKLLSWGFACLAALAGAGLARRWCDPRTGAWVGAAILCTPRMAELALHAKNDAAAAAFMAGSLLALSRGGRGWSVRAGLLLGGAVACKNTAAIGVPALLAACAFLPARRRRSAVRLLAASALPVLPWAAKNLLELGNPLAPLAVAWIPTLGRGPVNAELAARYAFTWTERRAAVPAGGVVDLLRIAGGLNGLIAAGVLAACIRWRLLRGREWLLACCAVFVLAWAAGLGWVGRYLAPVIAPATVLAAAVWAERGAWPVRLAMGSAALGVAMLAGGSGLRPAGPDPLGTYGEAVARAAAAGAQGRVLVTGDARTYPGAARLRAQLNEDTPVVWTLARESVDAGRLDIRMRQRGFTHLLFNLGQESFWAEYEAAFSWDRRSLAVYRDYWDRHAVLLWHSGEFHDVHGYLLLYRLRRHGGEHPFRAWLPGTGGEFAHLRRLAERSLSDPRLDAELDRLAALFGPRPEFLSRRGLLRARRGRWDEAAADFEGALVAAPEAAGVWATWGEAVPPAEYRTPSRLAARLDPQRAGAAARSRVCFGLGVPRVFPAGR